MGILTRFTDGLVNALTGAGTTTDPRSFNQYLVRRLSYQQIDATYRGGWVMRKIIDKPARELVREWRNWEAAPDDVKALEKAERKLGIRQKVEKALQLAGLGGAGMVLWVKGDNPLQPLDSTRIRKGALRSVVVYHRTRFSLGPEITDPDSDWAGLPEYYQLTTRGTGLDVKIHPSRVVAFKARPVPDMAIASWEEAFWGDSTVEVVLDAVANVDTAQNGFAALIKDARNRRLSVPELTRRVATAEGEAMLSKRVAALAMGESMFGVTFLDGGSAKDGSGGEKLEDRQMVWSGIPQIADMYMTAASGAADMPATVLWGKSPDGMNATGKSDKDLWEQTLKGKQDLDVGPCMDQLDAALIPSATGKQAETDDGDDISWEWRPLSVQTEAEEAKTFWDFMQGFTLLVDSGTMPTIAVEKMIQNKLIETRWFPGTDAVLNDIPEAERFPSLTAPDPSEPDPSAMQAGDPGNGGKEGDQKSPTATSGAPIAARRRAANDARFMDAAPKTLYVQRKLLNAAEFIRWAKSQGFDTTTPADELHVTIAFSRQPLDWMTIGQDWSSDKDGNLTVPAGGARIVQALGDKGAAVLLFASNDLTWRHKSILEAGASFDFDQYQPHVTITYAKPDGLDLAKVEPYNGPLKFGPELFSEVNDGWTTTITEE